jgi:hypothetical protein
MYLYRLLLFVMILIGAIQGASYGQDWDSPFDDESARRPAVTSVFANQSPLVGLFEDEPNLLGHDWLDLQKQSQPADFRDLVVRGQDSGGSGAADATDPSAILTQLQIQNIFTPETYDASGYSNNLILQPVLPFPVAVPGLKEISPAHIMRPTLPIIVPTADPDGPLGVQGGLGDLTLFDAGVHNIEGFGTIMLGYTAILPTSTDRQLGLGEWQLGPAAGVLYKQIPKTLLGFIYQQPFSFESDAQQILIEPILVRHLPNEWYIRWGELNFVFNTETGDYNIPLSFALGKVLTVGNQPINVFIEPFYTPEELRTGPASQWGVKLNVTLLFPEKKLDPLLGFLWGGHGCNCRRR